ncbi:hypothetical protein [Paractinoplanes hotanensis]|uniref:Uncharacterized protein n=1 Tax=Paractinoplanes hotanensis TaxID=2906497 RepID=A0ABT0Y849_9ACTN|nr:hypothetical protein [Actinoplanes hotanensis]MCM4082223.1 hypothetical protein [Actinoplanes hotanensis]
MTATEGETTAAEAALRWACREILTSPVRARHWLRAQPRRAEQQVPLMQIVRAEAHVRVGQGDQARQAAAAVLRIPGIEAGALLAGSAVLADTACWNGDRDAVELCLDYQRAAEAFTDYDRAWCAQALHAVAVYQQHSCAEGRQLLRVAYRTARQHGSDRLVAACAAALFGMGARCGRRSDPEQSQWAPVPGGLLCPAGSPRLDYLTSRLRRHPGTHSCRPAPPTIPHPLPDIIDKAPS